MLTSWDEVAELLAEEQFALSADAKLAQDSRQIEPGDVFVAIVGHEQDGARYIAKALEQQAALVLVSSNCQPELYQSSLTNNDRILVIQDLEQRLPEFAQAFYHSDKSLPLIGVTGTNGKTSITHLLGQLSKACMSVETAVIGTMGTGSIDAFTPSNNTTPGVCDVYRLLQAFGQDTKHDFQSVAMEVSSHALEQNRVKGLAFDVAIFTNLTLDHLDYHHTMEQYFAAKAKLFTDYAPKHAVINADDEYGRRLLNMVSSQARAVAYGKTIEVKQHQDYVYIARINCELKGLTVDFETRILGNTQSFTLSLPIYGEFNCSNLAAVLATALLLEWPIAPAHFSEIKSVPGRLELFTAPDMPVAIVDYAHTPDALEQSVKAVRSHLTGELTLVFGCGGDRDTSKRPVMAEIAERMADKVIVTNDNPRTESPEAIVADIQSGFSQPASHAVILDRKTAIKQALVSSLPTDAVLIAGKGHEAYQIIGQEVLDYDERAFTAETIAALSLTKLELSGSQT